MSFPHFQPVEFPDPETADENGIVCLGADLSPETLISAYRQGIFPWPMLGEGFPIPWCSPDPRAVIEFDNLHVSRRLARTIKSGKFRVTSDAAFAEVMRGCAAPRDDAEPDPFDFFFGAEPNHTWITPEMIAAYCLLHRLGVAHSVEVWHEAKLAGGVYGVASGGAFSGESMFYRVRDASKVALVVLVRHLEECGYRLFDIQQYTDHAGSMGATEISRRRYLQRLRAAVNLPISFGHVGS